MENTSMPQRPNNYLVVAILSTIFCCLPAGVVSIVYAAKVNELYASGSYDEAETASQNAKKWAIISAVAAIVVWVLYFIFFGALFLGGVQNGEFDF